MPGHDDFTRGLSVPRLADPSFRSAIQSVERADAGVKLPWGKIGTALGIVSTAASWILNKREQRDRREKLLREAKLFDPEADASVSEPQFVFGLARTPGVVGGAVDSGEFSRLYADNSRLRIRNITTVTLLSAGVLDSGRGLGGIRGLWVDGVRAPIVGNAVTRKWDTTGFRGQIPSLGVWSWALAQGEGEWFAEMQDVQRRMTALIPGWRPTADSDFANIPPNIDPVVRSLFLDLVSQWNEYVQSRRTQWVDNREIKTSAGGAAHAAREPVLTVYASVANPADLRDDIGVLQYATGTTPSATAGDAGVRANMPGWADTDRFEGTAWALNVHRFWRQGDEVAPRPNVPEVEYLLKGGGDFGGNAASAGKAILQLGPDPRTDAELEGLDAHVTRCGELLPVREMALADVGATDIPAGQLRWDEYRKVLWPNEDYPSSQVQQTVIDEVNAREAGAANAQPRYSINRVVTASEIESGEALALAGEAAGGYFVELAGRKVGFKLAQPKTAVVVLTKDDMLDEPEWSMGTPGPNAFETVLPADHERDWKSSTLPRTQNDAQVARDGLVLQTRQAWGQIDNLAAMRQDALLLDRDSVDKREGSLTIKVESATDPRGLLEPLDVIRIDAEAGDVEAAEVQMVQPLDGRMRLVVREIDADTYQDKYFATPLDRDPGPTNPGGPDMGINWGAAFRQTDTGRVLDLNLFLGLDVEQLEVKVEWRERVASSPPVPAEVEHYLATIDAAKRGAWFVHTVVDQAATSPLTVVADDATAEVFEGDRNRECYVTVSTLRGGVVGQTVESLIVPGVTTGGSPVTWQGQRETEINLPTVGFSGWLVQLYDVKALTGTLVYSWTGGGATGTDYQEFSTTTTDNVHVQNDANTLNKTWIIIQNTFDLEENQNTMTLAARTGAGTSSDPYVYSAGVAVDLLKFVRPDDLSVEVSDTPTGRGAFPGQWAYILEE